MTPFRVYKSSIFPDYCQDTNLKNSVDRVFKDFTAYLKKSRQNDFGFGRDSKYDHPNTPEWLRSSSLRHVHILPLEEFLNQIRTYKKNKFNITSDIHIIYSSFYYNKVKYFVAVTLVYPDAHSFANTHLDAMRKCVDISLKFEDHIIQMNRNPKLANNLKGSSNLVLAANQNNIQSAITNAILDCAFPHRHLFTEEVIYGE